MAASVLTPNMIWANFKIEDKLNGEVISEKITGNLVVSDIYFDGRKVGDDRVKIFATKVKKVDSGVSPAIIIAQKYIDGSDITFAKELAKKGYVAFLVNLGGVKEGEKNYTHYPPCVSYADYDPERSDAISTEGSVINTCFYEWACVMLYAHKFLSEDALVSKIGAIAIDEFANALWQASCVADFSCAVIVGNAGRRAYKGINKFSNVSEKTLTDNEVRFIAGIDSQSYAMHVKCPLLLLAPTNSPVYDVDRVYDTISAIPKNVYRAVDYSVGSRFTIDYKCFNNAIIFFEEFLKLGKSEEINLPKELNVKAELAGGKIAIEVLPDTKGLKKLRVFCGEDTEESRLRMWQVVSDASKCENDKYTFEYRPYKNSSKVMMFAKAEYESGFRICSNIICKQFEKDEIEGNHRFKVLYTSRIQNGRRFFAPLVENEFKPTGLDTDKNCPDVCEKKGPFDIVGLYARGGLLTFKIGAEKYKPNDDEMLMLDAFVKEGGDIKITLVTDFFGNKQNYTATAKVIEGVWQNIKLAIGDFKTENGVSLKSYSKVDAIEITSNKEFVVNNILWI